MTNAILLSILPSFGPALILLVFLILLIAFLASNIIIVPQASAFIIERLGAYQTTWETGLHFKLPLVERVANKVTLKERVSDFPPQPVITKDNIVIFAHYTEKNRILQGFFFMSRR